MFSLFLEFVTQLQLLRSYLKRCGPLLTHAKHEQGLLSQEDKVIIVDDTITSGSSLISSIKEVEKQGCKVIQTFVVFDRGEGGPENLENAGYKINSIFKYDQKENKLI